MASVKKKSGRKKTSLDKAEGTDLHITITAMDILLLKQIKDTGKYTTNSDVFREALRQLATK